MEPVMNNPMNPSRRPPWYKSILPPVCATLFGATVSHLTMAGTVAQSPLFLTVSVPPNLVVTLDDSGSMRRAFVPEVCGDSSNCAYLDNRYGKAAHNNAIHYNPNVTYTPPKNADGTSRPSSSDMSSTSSMYATVYRNGFDTSFGTVNLSSAYRPTAYLDFGAVAANAATEAYMDHYTSSSGDVRCVSSSCKYTVDGGGSWINMTSASSCSSDSTCQTRTMPAYYHVFDPDNSNCSGTDAQKKEDNDCYDIKIVSDTSGPGGTDERQNFANWYAFYRTRNLATVSGASLAFADMDPTFRVAWQALNSCRGSTTDLVDTDCDGWKNNFSGKSNAIKAFTGTHKNNFYDWLFQVPTNSGTPLREAMTRVGEYYKTSGENSPYDNDFTTGSSGELACRRNAHILMTDGIWNDSGFSSIGNVDGTSTTLPDGKSYTATPPYSDTYSDTLADVAFKYWATDLRNLTNNLTPLVTDRSGTEDARYKNPRNNPATWQHMVNYTIGLGLTDFLADAGLVWTGDMYEGSYPDILAGTTQWPDANLSMGSAGASYGRSAHDLWHAAINSRGEFFSVETPDALSQAFKSILSSVKTTTSSSAAVATNSTRLDTNSAIYQARFDSSDWSGSLRSFSINPDGSIGSQLWDAALQIPSEASRNIVSYDPNATGTKGISFAWSNLSSAQKSALDPSCTGSCLTASANPILDYIRGIRTGEGTTYRRRNTDTVLGDIVNSDPWFVGSENFGYGDIRHPSSTDPTDPVNVEGASYTTFRSSTAYAQRRRMIYVGANDGMLHGFDAGTYVPADTASTPPVPEHFTTGTGLEKFAYVPNAVLGNLNQLTSLSYAHKYYVDGSPRSGDAYIDIGSGKQWRTVLLGTTGAGGKGVFALDITAPDSFAASNVLWEISAASSPFSADLADVTSGSKTIPGLTNGLGYTVPQPSIVRMANGSWAAIVANGYGSTSNKAVLYIVNVETGQIIKRIDTEAGSSTSPNGLSTPIAVDINNDRIVDYVYAGDLLGNMWKFDVTNSSASQWDVAYKSGSTPKPLFVACVTDTTSCSSADRQPITAKPQVGRVGADQNGGVMVYFGTGKYFEVGDNTVDANNDGVVDAQKQTFYGIWDNGAAVSRRADLQVQTIDEELTRGGFGLRVSSNTAVDYSTKKGWFMDLVKPPSSTLEGERVVSFPLLRGGRLIFTTLIPSPHPCEFGGTGWIMELDAVTGSRLPSAGGPPWDIYGSSGAPDGAINSQDLVRSTTSAGCTSADCSPSGKKSNIGIIKTPGVISAGEKEYKYTSGSSGALEVTTESAGGAGGRQSWRQLR